MHDDAVTPADARAILATPPCADCGGYHAHACFRVQSMTGTYGEDRTAVTYHPVWDRSTTLWRADLQRIAAQHDADTEADETP